MRKVDLSRDFLHRCCVQLSSRLDELNIAQEIQYFLRFARSHGKEHANELTRALVWRIVNTNDSDFYDRAGAWSLLDAVLVECGEEKNDLSRTAVADKIYLFLPYLIEHRWFTLEGRRDATETSRTTNASKTQNNTDSHPTYTPQNWNQYACSAGEKEKLRRLYRSFVNTWKKIWRSDVYRQLKEVVQNVELNGNYLKPKGKRFLDIPATFSDSLWRLRRSYPRPVVARHMLFSYGWSPPQLTFDSVGTKQPLSGSDTLNSLPTKEDLKSLDQSIHPKALLWLNELIQKKGGCTLCDTWRHTESHCPCEAPFRKSVERNSDGKIVLRRRDYETSEKPEMSFVAAVEKLFRCDIRLPLSVEKALDTITKLIQDEMPYEEVIEAFDIVRGAITGPSERHALWLHAEYRIRPSKTVFDKPNDEALSPTLEKILIEFKNNRRFREWDRLLNSVETLDTQFRRCRLDSTLLEYLESVRRTESFFFCLVDGSLPSEFSAETCARVPNEVTALRPLKDTLCPVCLEPFHAYHNCPRSAPKELWDLRVARLVLEDNNLLHMRFPEESNKLDEALNQIDFDDRQAKEFRKCELRLAVLLVHETRRYYCKYCSVIGHSFRQCTYRAKATLESYGISEVDVRLDPNLISDQIAILSNSEEDRKKRMGLQEALELLGNSRRTYPSSFLLAIRELTDAAIPLAAARYATDAVQSFLFSIKFSDLLQHLLVLKDESFPDVCLFCDSYKHSSDKCSYCKREEREFLLELDRFGLNLWQYIQKKEYYDQLIPTDYARGKEIVISSIRQFTEDYGPGGIARIKFVQNNQLTSFVASATPKQPEFSSSLSAAEMTLTQLSGVGFSPFRGSFSELVPKKPTSAIALDSIEQRDLLSNDKVGYLEHSDRNFHIQQEEEHKRSQRYHEHGRLLEGLWDEERNQAGALDHKVPTSEDLINGAHPQEHKEVKTIITGGKRGRVEDNLSESPPLSDSLPEQKTRHYKDPMDDISISTTTPVQPATMITNTVENVGE